MVQSKFTLYEYIKLDDGAWRYKKAAFHFDHASSPRKEKLLQTQSKAFIGRKPLPRWRSVYSLYEPGPLGKEPEGGPNDMQISFGRHARRTVC